MEKQRKLLVFRYVFPVFQCVRFILIFIKNIFQYAFISVSCLLYACLIADYQSVWQEGKIYFYYIENNINC